MNCATEQTASRLKSGQVSLADTHSLALNQEHAVGAM